MNTDVGTARPPRRLDDDLAQQVAEAIWPWVLEQRWSPFSPPANPTALALWDLGGDDEPRRETAPEDAGGTTALILLLRTTDPGCAVQVPLVAEATKGHDLATSSPCIGPSVGKTDRLTLHEGALSPQFWRAWARGATVVSGSRRELEESAAKVSPLGMEQSNTSVILEGTGRRLIAKVFRVLHRGLNPEVELPAALTLAQWHGVPLLRATSDLPATAGRDAAMEELPPDATFCSAVVSEAIEDTTDGFDLFVALAQRNEDPWESAASLGRTVGQMHRILSRSLGPGIPLSAPELLANAQKVLEGLAATGLPEFEEGSPLRAALSAAVSSSSPDVSGSIATQRIHGDLHLGQTLRTRDGNWFILDFEGEPLQSMAERTRPAPPSKDVAGMLRSFDYAWQRGRGGRDTAGWTARARAGFLAGYRHELRPPGSERTGEAEQGDEAEQEALERLFEMMKAAYELRYELQFRPSYVSVPLTALKLLAQTPSDPPRDHLDVRDFEHD